MEMYRSHSSQEIPHCVVQVPAAAPHSSQQDTLACSTAVGVATGSSTGVAQPLKISQEEMNPPNNTPLIITSLLFFAREDLQPEKYQKQSANAIARARIPSHRMGPGLPELSLNSQSDAALLLACSDLRRCLAYYF